MSLLDFLRGPAGPAGPPGPQGPPGVDGSGVVSVRGVIPNDATPTDKTYTVTAPEGYRFLFIPYAGAEPTRDEDGAITSLSWTYNDGSIFATNVTPGTIFDLALYQKA